MKPSVMKPEVHVKPGQKRSGAERSAVAAVKPLNSASTVQEEPLQTTTCNDKQVRGNWVLIIPCVLFTSFLSSLVVI